MQPKNRSLAAPLVVRPKEAWQMLDVGNDTGYRLIATGELESYLEGTARKITVRSIEAYIARRIAAEPNFAVSRPAM